MRRLNSSLGVWVRGVMFISLSITVALLAIGVNPGGVALAVDVDQVYDTVTEFNTGTLYHTGLTVDSAGGGDNNGEVRLLTVGINPTTWNRGLGASGVANDTNLPARWGHAAAQFGGRIYVAGGNTSPLASTALNSVHYTTINADHNLANWIATTPLPGKRWLHAMAAVNGFIYVLGGLDEAAAPQDTVFKAKINANGTLGAWTTNNVAALPVAMSDLATAVIGNQIYVIGGDDNSQGAVDTVYTAQPDGSGNIASWQTASALSRSTSRHAATSSESFLYVAGGADFGASQFYPYAVYGGANSTSIGWTDTDPLPVNLVYASGIAFGSQLYIVGGAFNDGASLENNVRSNLINTDGSLIVNGWTSSPVLSSPRQRTAAVLSDDGWIYVIQGQSGDLTNGGTALKTIDYGPTAAAGATAFAPSGVYTSQVFDIGTSRPIKNLSFNTSVPTGTSMSFEYRVSDLIDFSDAPNFIAAGSPAGGNLVSTNIPLNVTKRYLQFRVNFDANSTKDKSPVLNRVSVTYDSPISPTPTLTRTLTPTVTKTPAGATNTPTTTPTVTETPNPCAGKPAKPVLSSPKNKSTVKVRRPKLKWSGSQCQTTKFKVLLKKGTKKGDTVVNTTVGKPQLRTVTLTKSSNYVWHVQACNGKKCSLWTKWWKFKVAANAK